MRRFVLILVVVAWFVGVSPSTTAAQSAGSAALPAPSSPIPRTIDGVAARIEDDILTESEVRELGAFQQLVDGQSKPRADLIRELGDQWIVRGEATAAKYPQPSEEDVDHAYAQLAARFSSPEEFKSRCTAVGLTQNEIHRLLSQQLYLARFLDYRFRPAAQIDQKEIESYYNDELVPELKSRGQQIPTLDDVEDTIREVLVQRAISERAAQWLEETRARLKIDILASEGRP